MKLFEVEIELFRNGTRKHTQYARTQNTHTKSLLVEAKYLSKALFTIRGMPGVIITWLGRLNVLACSDGNFEKFCSIFAPHFENQLSREMGEDKTKIST